MDIFIVRAWIHRGVSPATHRLAGVVEHVGVGELATFSDGGELLTLIYETITRADAEVVAHEFDGDQ